MNSESASTPAGKMRRSQLARLFSSDTYGPRIMLFAYLSLFFGLHAILIAHGPLGISGDEALYWLWSRHIAWGYPDKAPMIAWLTTIGTHLFGSSAYGIRALAPAFSIAASICVYLLAKMIWDARAGLLAALIFNVIPIYFLGGIVFTTDVLLVTFWLSTLTLVWIALERDKAWAWYGAGFSLGLGLLSKYNMGLLPVGILCYLLYSDRHRKVLKQPHPYLAALIAASLLSPNLYWNATHGWVTMHATWGNVTGGHGGVTAFVKYLGGQIGTLSPFIAMLLVYGTIQAWRDKKTRMLIFASIFSLCFYTFKAWTSQINANWPVASYLGLIIAASGPLTNLALTTIRRLSIGTAAFFVAVGLSLPALAQAGIRLPQAWLIPYNQTMGWRRLADTVFDSHPAHSGDLIVSNFYQLCAVLQLYNSQHQTVYFQSLGWAPLPKYNFIHTTRAAQGRTVLFVLTGRTGQVPARWRGSFATCSRPKIIGSGGGSVIWHRVTVIKCFGKKTISAAA